MIERVKIKNFCGRVDYDLNFKNTGLNGRLIFLTGPIGYGKSLILRMLYWASHLSLNEIKNIKFDNFEIFYSGFEKNYRFRCRKYIYGGGKHFGCYDAGSESARLFSYEYGSSNCRVLPLPKPSEQTVKEYRDLLKEHYRGNENKLLIPYYSQSQIIPSKGEMNLNMLYEFLYNKEGNQKFHTLLLDGIEENLHMINIEILSKHINKFVRDNPDKQLIIATHSPALINGQWDCAIDLFDNSKRQYEESCL